MSPDVTNKEVQAGKKILDSKVLSDDGRRWLMRAIDPFHDSPVRPAGYPDKDNSPSVVQEVNLSYTVARPAELAADALWDTHIFNYPDFANIGSSNLTWGTLNVYTGAFSPYAPTPKFSAPSGVIACSGAAGQVLLPDVGLGVPQTVGYNSVNATRYLSSRCRIVGMGIEVTNTTAEIYRQGMVTCYRMPQSQDELINVNTGSNGFSVCRKMYIPPATVEQALILPGSKQWAAERGAYLVATQAGDVNPAQGVDNLGRCYVDRTMIASAAPSVGCMLLLSSPASPMSPALHSPYNTSGAYFTGLSPQTTLQVNVKYLIEAVPDPRSPFVTLAENSPDYDPEALRLYSELVTRLPVGVPVDENPDGEWFRTVLGTLGQISHMAGGINPVFSLIGTGLSAASTVVPGIVDAINAHRSSQKKKQNLTPPNTPMIPPKNHDPFRTGLAFTSKLHSINPKVSTKVKSSTKKKK